VRPSSSFLVSEIADFSRRRRVDFTSWEAMCYNSSCTEKGDLKMENDATVGWIAAIVIGGIAGWLAEQFMKSDTGMLVNIALGIVGAIVANAILGVVGINLGGWLGYLIAGFIGACILIAIGRMFRRAT
jgi:uncharacterized membrane protein YeaQ/YmgE (transglycosylase-associated protein family)